MSAQRLQLAYQPPGPVAARFLACRKFVQGIMGPVGSGKTSALTWKCVMMAMAQAPSPVDGVRRFKVGAIRNTYRELTRTTIPSWTAWWPKGMGEWKGGSNEPATHTLTLNMGAAGTVELIAEFIAIGDQNVEDALRGWESTVAWLNEADLVAPEVFNFVTGRVGRYPSAVHGGASWKGVLMDFNAPDTENWVYKLFWERRPEEAEVFVQPGGMDPGAENLANLPEGYYQQQAAVNPEWYVDRMVHNRFGYSRDGKPVFPEFNDKLHVAGSDLEPVSGLPLSIGLDAGGSPAASIRQRMPDGQWRTLDELVAEPGTGPARFGEMLNQLLAQRYRGMKAQGWCDPSAAYGGDKASRDDQDWLTKVRAATSLTIMPAPTNNLTPRLEALRLPLTRMIDGRVPGFLLSPRCTALRKAYNSGYRYKRIRAPGETRFSDEPEKNQYSHPIDAEQYVALGGGEWAEVTGRATMGQAKPTVVRKNFSIFGAR